VKFQTFPRFCIASKDSINERVLGYFIKIKKVANSIKTMRKIEYSIIDTTGFGFGEDEELRFKRGKELRRV